MVKIDYGFQEFLSKYSQLKESLAELFGIGFIKRDHNKMTIRSLVEGSTVVSGSVDVESQEEEDQIVESVDSAQSFMDSPVLEVSTETVGEFPVIGDDGYSSDNTKLVIGLAVGIGIIVVAVIAIAALSTRKAGKEERAPSTEEREMPQDTAEHLHKGVWSPFMISNNKPHL